MNQIDITPKGIDVDPVEIGAKYNKIATWWHDRHFDSAYGVASFNKALVFCQPNSKTLDVGCGAGGRFINLLNSQGMHVTGIDVSRSMINLAKVNHPDNRFILSDICTWQTDEQFDFIFAWDSIFHLPLNMHKLVIDKLSSMLTAKGILAYTFGNAEGENTSEWLNDTFYYSSIGINENIKQLMANGLTLLHLELDQYPEKHTFVVAQK